MKLNLGFILEKINKDSIVISMTEHGYLVGISIAVDILGYGVWKNLDKDEKDAIIAKIDKIKLKEKLM